MSSVKELPAKNTILAIASGDPGEEYLLKVTGNGPEILQTEQIKDDWGMCFPTRAEVLRGHFFVRQEEDLSRHS